MASEQSNYRVDPIYIKMTTPGKNLPSVMDMFGHIAQSSHYKVSLHLSDAADISRADSDLSAWLVSCGVLGTFNSTSQLRGINSLRYEFMCDGASLPGYDYQATNSTGHYQGLNEQIPIQKNFQTVSLSFYVGREYGILRLFQEWSNFISPLSFNGRDRTGNSSGQVSRKNIENDFIKYRYPNTYRRDISITKFERDVHNQGGYITKTPNMLTYRLIDAYPIRVDNISLGYDQSELTRVNVTLAYTRYLVFDHAGTGQRQNPVQRSPQQTRDPETGTQVVLSDNTATLISQSGDFDPNYYDATRGLDGFSNPPVA